MIHDLDNLLPGLPSRGLERLVKEKIRALGNEHCLEANGVARSTAHASWENLDSSDLIC